MARDLKFRILKVEGLYYLCSENKGADQLRGYREADLRLCFRICKTLVSHDAVVHVPTPGYEYFITSTKASDAISALVFISSISDGDFISLCV